MTISTQTTGPRGSATGALTTKRRQAGTSLVEILVVIVIFLIGILAVIQVFPGGFRLLLTARNNSVATAIARDAVERIKANPELLPEQVLAVRYVGNVPTVDPNIDPWSLAIVNVGDTLDGNGMLTAGGSNARDWMYATGPNLARRIIGEGQRVPVPRVVGNNYGGLMVLDHGPIDPGPNPTTDPSIVAYANDLTRNLGLPREATPADPVSGWNVSVPGNGNVTSQWVETPISLAPFEFFVVNPSTPGAALMLPTSNFNRVYRIRVSATIAVAGNYTRLDYISLSVAVPAMPSSALQSKYPLVYVGLNNILAANNALPGGGTLASAETDTIRVAPRYIRLAPAAAWSGDPFEMKILDPNLGVLLFSQYAREGVVNRPGGTSEPLVAKVDYDVLDWRILRDDFRLNADEGTLQLALQSLKVGNNQGPDGRQNGPIPVLENGVSATDNVVIVDVTTGGIVREIPDDVRIDKSRGTVTFTSKVPADKLTIDVPNGGARSGYVPIVAPLANRPLRVLYRARNEWSVQIIKGAAQYTLMPSLPPGGFYGACYVGGGASGGGKTRIYFPKSDVGQKVTIDRISYYDTLGNLRVLEGQDFQIQNRAIDSILLPSIDLLDVVGDADHLAGTASGDVALPPVVGVKGASLAVRVLWNPDAFTFTSNSDTNFNRVGIYNRGWRKSVTETYLRAEELR